MVRPPTFAGNSTGNTHPHTSETTDIIIQNICVGKGLYGLTVMRRFYGRDGYSQSIGVLVDIFAAEIVTAKNVVDDINIAELFISDMVITQIYARCGICAQNAACRINIYFQISYNNA